MAPKVGKSVTSGFSPMIFPRPEYDSNTKVIKEAVAHHVRALTKLLLFTHLAHSSYTAFASWWLGDGANGGWSERSLFVAGVMLTHSVLYWSVNAVFLACDRHGWLEQFKLERTDAMGPSEELLQQTWRQALFGQTVVAFAILWYLYPVAQWGGMPSALAPLPSVLEMAKFFLACHVINDWGFYWSHRTAHAVPLYAFVHKQHHTYKGTIGFAAEFAGPIEQALSNQLPTMGYAIASGGHPLLQLVWLAARLCQTYEGHSGYCFYGTWMYDWHLLGDAAAYHDFHHTKNSGNFGATYLDHFFGTMDTWIRVGRTAGYVATKRKGVVGNVLRNDHPSRKAKAV